MKTPSQAPQPVKNYTFKQLRHLLRDLRLSDSFDADTSARAAANIEETRAICARLQGKAA